MERQLAGIAREIVLLFRASPDFSNRIIVRNYHGLLKGKIPDDSLRAACAKFSADPGAITAEVVSVASDLSKEVHMHKLSHSHCIVLGPREHMEAPRNAMAFRHNKWVNLSVGEELDIPPRSVHGFTAHQGGVAHFVLVQSPPAETDDGLSDDYVRAEKYYDKI